MAYNLVLELNMMVNTQEEGRKIIEAVESGLAEIAIKERVLFGDSMPKAPASSGKKRASEPQQELKRVETHVHESPKQVVEEPVAERPRGIFGRGRMERSSD